MGGAYIGPPSVAALSRARRECGASITQGIPDFMVNAEQHYVTYDKDPKYVLLEAEKRDLEYENYEKSISGWAYEHGKGRVVFTSVGHTIHAMWVPAHLELQKRSVRWLLKQI